MKWLYIYIGVGLLFACLFCDDKDKRVITHPGLTIAFLFIYPFLVWYYAFRIKSFKWKSKVIWERKQ